MQQPLFDCRNGTRFDDTDLVRYVVDGHVHLYAVDDALPQVSRACKMLAAYRADWSIRPVIPSLLALDTSSFDTFSKLYAAAPNHGDSGFIKAADEYGLFLKGDGALLGMLVGGMQFAAREGFEVLGVGCRLPIEDGQAAEDIISSVERAGGLPILPWAFGKWFGKRGREVCRVMRSERAGLAMLGDNALRPARSGCPSQFRLAGEAGKPILPGSDPLPLQGDAARIGSYGFEFEGNFSEATPISTFMDELTKLDGQPRSVGRRLGWGASLLTQVKIRVAKESHVSHPAT